MVEWLVCAKVLKNAKTIHKKYQLINQTMEKQQMKQPYRNPIVKVVRFRVEDAFLSPGPEVTS